VSVAVIVPLVLLAGYTGCHLVFGLQIPPAPTDLQATAVDIDRIDLTWEDNSGGRFRVKRAESGNPLSKLEDVDAIPGLQLYQDVGLPQGQAFDYRVFLILDGEESSGSNIASATTLMWKNAFTQGPNALEGQPRGGLADDTVVQRLSSGLLAFGGPKVRVTLRGSLTADLRLLAATIAPAASAGDLWDSEGPAPPTPLLFQGQAGVLIPAGMAVPSDVTTFTLDNGRDLILAFDVGAPANGRVRTGLSGAQAFVSPAGLPPEAGVSDRSPGYANNLETSTVFFVEKIEVLA
jgi:hypothetical protein